MADIRACGIFNGKGWVMPVNLFLMSRRLSGMSAVGIGSVLLVFLFLVCIVSNASADSISLFDTSGSTPAPISYSIPGYSGQTEFNNVAVDQYGNTIATLSLTVDYAVFAPGEVSYSPLGTEGQTSADGTFSIGNFTASDKDYVYAYQIFNSSASTAGLLGLSIGFNPDLPAGTVDDSVGESNATLPSNLAVQYAASYVESDATLFSYYPTQDDPSAPDIAPGQESYFLLTSSPYSPFFAGSLQYGAYTTNVGGTVEYLSSPSSTIPVAGMSGTSPGAVLPLPQSFHQGLDLMLVGLLMAGFSRIRLIQVFQKRAVQNA